MIVPFLLKAYYPNHKDIIDNRVKWFQEVISVVVCLCCFYGVSMYKCYNDSETLRLANMAVLSHSIIDLFFCRTELFVHHVVLITFFYLYYTYDHHHIDNDMVIATLMNTEISTMFITIRNILQSKELQWIQTKSYFPLIQNINDLLFAFTFGYTRIYCFTKYVILNYDYLHHYNSIVVYSAFYCLYALNLYWFAIILKKGFRFFKHIHFSALTTENILQYTCIGYFTISLITYYPYNNWNYIFDLGGQLAIAISSYNYHHSIYQKLQTIYPNIEFDNLDDSILPSYQIDVYTILMRNCMNTLTHLGIFSPYINHYYILYWFGSNKYTVILYSVIFHGTFAISAVSYLQYLKSNHIRFSYTENHGPKYLIISTLVSLPIVVSVILAVINTIQNNYHLGVFYGLSLYITILIRLINVGYGLNHILFHFAYASMTYCAVISNKQLLT